VWHGFREWEAPGEPQRPRLGRSLPLPGLPPARFASPPSRGRGIFVDSPLERRILRLHSRVGGGLGDRSRLV
jgi:hypothetical protein